MTWDRHSDEGDLHRYDDMLELAHHVSLRHPQMSRDGRAAQFSPFAALVGYDDEVMEAGRTTERKRELSESEKACLDERLRIIQAWIDRLPGKWDFLNTETASHQAFVPPEVTISHFVADERKAGGEYVTTRGRIKRIDLYERSILMRNGETIRMENVLNIEGEGLDGAVLI